MSKKKTIYIKKSDVIRYAEWEGAYKALMYISRLPAEDVKPVKHGRWVWDSNAPHREHGVYKCNKCGCHSDFEENYCYNCGAKMDLKEGEENDKN